MISNLLNLKNDFPIFKKEDVVYLDTASTSQKPQCVIDTITEFYSKYNSNVHRGLYPWAEKATSNYENARTKIANFINTSSQNLIFTKGTTESINFVSQSWGDNNVSKRSNIVVSEMEHHSNIVPWQTLAQKTGAELRYIPISNSGELILDNIDSIIDQNTKIVSIIHQSNVFGTINSIGDIIDIAHSKGSVVLVDAAQSIAHQKIDVQDLNCDFLVFSGHKILGPTGVGCLYIKEDLLHNLEPYQTGGQMINQVYKDKSTWNDIPFRFEAGTPNISGVLGLSSAIDYINEIGLEKIKLHNKALTEYCLKELENIKDIDIYGHKNNAGPVISFNIKDVHSYDLAQLLAQQNIFIRAGHHCAQPIMNKLNIQSSNRLSLYIYNDFDDVNRLIAGIEKSVQIVS